MGKTMYTQIFWILKFLNPEQLILPVMFPHESKGNQNFLSTQRWKLLLRLSMAKTTLFSLISATKMKRYPMVSLWNVPSGSMESSPGKRGCAPTNGERESVVE